MNDKFMNSWYIISSASSYVKCMYFWLSPRVVSLQKTKVVWQYGFQQYTECRWVMQFLIWRYSPKCSFLVRVHFPIIEYVRNTPYMYKSPARYNLLLWHFFILCRGVKPVRWIQIVWINCDFMFFLGLLWEYILLNAILWSFSSFPYTVFNYCVILFLKLSDRQAGRQTGSIAAVSFYCGGPEICTKHIRLKWNPL